MTNFFFRYSFWLCQNIGGNKFSATGVSHNCVKSRGRRKKKKEERKKERRAKVGDNNGQATKILFLHISSSYVKILGETNFQPRELPWSGSKEKDVERKKERREEFSEYNGQYLSPEPIVWIMLEDIPLFWYK